MCSCFGHFCASDECVRFWSTVYTAAGVTTASPLLSFYVTYTMFINYWKEKHHPTHENDNPSIPSAELRDDEQGALWYVGGYLIKAISKNLQNNEFLMVLESFKEGDKEGDEEALDETHEKSMKWFNRGGLTRCTNEFYNFITSLEKEMKAIISNLPEKINTTTIVEQLKLSDRISQTWKQLEVQFVFKRGTVRPTG